MFFYPNNGGNCEIGKVWCDSEGLPYSAWAMDMQEPYIIDEEMLDND